MCMCLGVMHYCIVELGQWLRGLNKGQKKEIYFCNKAKIFSSFSFFFCLYWCMYFITQNSRSLKQALDYIMYNLIIIKYYRFSHDRCSQLGCQSRRFDCILLLFIRRWGQLVCHFIITLLPWTTAVFFLWLIYNFTRHELRAYSS